VPGSKSDYTEGNLLRSVFQGAAFPVPTTVYVSLHNGLVAEQVRDQNATAHTSTEVTTTGTGYTRASVPSTTAWWAYTASGGTAQPSRVNNAQTISFPTPSAGWGTIYAFGVYDAVTAGNLLYWGDMVGATLAAYCTAANPCVLSCAGHGLTAGMQVRVWSAANMGMPALPAGLSDEQVYYVGNVAGDNFSLFTTPGTTSPVATTTSGLVLFAQDQSQVVNTGNTVQFAANGIVVQED
jgi:hypothetical protein